MAVATPAALAQQLKYGPLAGAKIQRSQYLADALKAVATPEKAPQSWGELGARLLATAVLNRAGKKADRQALEAYQGYQNNETDATLASLGRPPVAIPAAAPAPPPQAEPVSPPTQSTVPPPVPVQQQPLPAPASSPYSPQDRDALIRMMVTEAIGEGPQGMAAAGHVALNRLKSGYGGAKSLQDDVIYAPHQFEGIARRAVRSRPQDYGAAQQIADGIL
jgi:spore germination cell wall hydrolase CwlJ-like protein